MKQEAPRKLGTLAIHRGEHVSVCYATGLRISEAVHLKPAAIDSRRMVIRVDQVKGGKDRYVMLPPILLDLLRDYWRRTRPGEWLFQTDATKTTPG
jgi:integrase/recombinase XerD